MCRYFNTILKNMSYTEIYNTCHYFLSTLYFVWFDKYTLSFNIELKDVPKEEKSKRAKELYSTFSAEEKEELEKEAKLGANVDLESMAQEDVENV